MHTFNFNGFESWRDSFRFKSDTVHEEGVSCSCEASTNLPEEGI